MAKFQINNQKGSFTLIGLLITMLSLSILSFTVIKKLELHFELRKLLRQYTCMKEFNGKTIKYVNFMEKTNWLIENIDNLEIILLFFPQLKVAGTSLKSLKVALKRMQDAKSISYLQNINSIDKNNCPIPLNAYISPYKFLKRSKDGKAPLRKSKWSLYFWGTVKVKINYQVKNKKLKIKSTQLM